MKKHLLKKIIAEAIDEVSKEDNINLDEIDFGSLFKSKPVTDEDIAKYLNSRPRDKQLLNADPERKAKWIEFVKSNKVASKALRSGEIVFAIYDPKTGEYSERKSSGMSSPTSFGEGKEESDKNINNAVEEGIKTLIEDGYKEKDIQEFKIKLMKTLLNPMTYFNAYDGNTIRIK